MNRLLYGLCVMFVGLGTLGAFTVRAQAPATAYNARGGVAIKGYDAVAYHSEGRAVTGQAKFTHDWDGVRWQFASAENRDAFVIDPRRFVPAFGGYCAYGVSRGYGVDIDPEAFAIVEGTLYLNYSKRVQRTWNEDRPGYIEKARARWPGVLSALKQGGDR